MTSVVIIVVNIERIVRKGWSGIPESCILLLAHLCIINWKYRLICGPTVFRIKITLDFVNKMLN